MSSGFGVDHGRMSLLVDCRLIRSTAREPTRHISRFPLEAHLDDLGVCEVVSHPSVNMLGPPYATFPKR